MLKFALLTLCAGSALAQAVPPSQTLEAASLKNKGVELLTKARNVPAGLASEVLLKRPESSIQMAVRVKSGQGEWHHDDADILIGVEGSAQIVTGGEIVNGKETAPGEIRGDSVKGGTTQTFKAGDYIRIEPQVAHQVLLAPGSTFRYMAVKVRAAQ
ncbi:MAG: cupin domain-containing protein [Janthinobacterium lividum]